MWRSAVERHIPSSDDLELDQALLLVDKDDQLASVIGARMDQQPLRLGVDLAELNGVAGLIPTGASADHLQAVELMEVRGWVRGFQCGQALAEPAEFLCGQCTFHVCAWFVAWHQASLGFCRDLC